jgi:phosphoglycolate phosphatase-like HAD superfamily hydrolase
MDNTIFLDLDGVLADFDAHARAILGTNNSYHWEWVWGTEAFWEKLHATPGGFFRTMPLTPDALQLWDTVKHRAPVILTALPKRDDTDVASQKRAWVSEHFGPDVQVITCTTSEKPNYCNPTDILVDDRNVNAKLWTQRGGDFVLHTSAAASIERLHQLNAL